MTNHDSAPSVFQKKPRKQRPLKAPEHKRTERVACYITPSQKQFLVSQGVSMNRWLKETVQREIDRRENEARIQGHLREAARLQAERVALTTKTVSGEWD